MSGDKKQPFREAAPAMAAGVTLGGAVGIVLVWVIETYAIGAPMPGVVASAIGTICASSFGYFLPGGRP